MKLSHSRVVRCGTLLAINFLFLTIWGFMGMGKVISGMPPWFAEKFAPTILGKFPGVAAIFWLLTAQEVLVGVLALLAFVTGEFLERMPMKFLPLMLVGSLFVFTQLSFGQWLTGDYNATYQLFLYFSGTLLALHVVSPLSAKGTEATANTEK